MNIVIVIPIYKKELSNDERHSFKQCLNVLGQYNMILLTYKGLDYSEYEQIAKSTIGKDLEVEFFDRDYFNSIYDYNRLCLSLKLYQRFATYKYMLIYQLDAWVFRNELEDWCNKGIDYVGAPWFVEDSHGNLTYQLMNVVGNGGLSLRRIDFCIEVLSDVSHRPLLTPKGILKMHGTSWKELWKFPLRLIGIRNSVASFINEKERKFLNEDLFYARFKYSYKKYNIPNPTEALKFSFEAHPSFLFNLNNKQLPFGCHGYLKNEYKEFWQHHITYEK